jgi:hypothetical protein
MSEERLKLENELLLTKSKAQMINLYLDKLKEIEELKAEIKELNDDNVWWTNRFNAVERDNEKLNNIINEAREYIDNDFNRFDCFGSMAVSMEMNYKREELLEILDKENK